MKRAIRAVSLMMLGIILCSILFHNRQLHSLWQEMHTNYIVLLNQSAIQKELLMQESQDENLQKLQEKVVLIRYENIGEIKNEQLARSATPYILKMNGTTSVAFPDTFLLTQEDADACLIDYNTAIALFGSTNVVGKEVAYNEHSYYIYGLVESKQPVFVCLDEMNKNDESYYYQVAIVHADSQEAMEEITKQLKFYFGIEGKTYPLWTFELALDGVDFVTNRFSRYVSNG